jgi:hypothetical protein
VRTGIKPSMSELPSDSVSRRACLTSWQKWGMRLSFFFGESLHADNSPAECAVPLATHYMRVRTWGLLTAPEKPDTRDSEFCDKISSDETEVLS